MSTAGYKVFVVEALPIVRFGLERLIEDTDHLELSGSVGDGKTALRSMREARPDLVITSLSLPDVTGLTLIKEIRRSEPSVPILVFARSAAELVGEPVVEMGATDYVEQSDSIEVLRRKIDETLLAAR